MKIFLCPAQKTIDVLQRIFTRINGTSGRNDAVRNEKTRPELIKLYSTVPCRKCRNFLFFRLKTKAKRSHTT